MHWIIYMLYTPINYLHGYNEAIYATTHERGKASTYRHSAKTMKQKCFSHRKPDSFDAGQKRRLSCCRSDVPSRLQMPKCSRAKILEDLERPSEPVRIKGSLMSFLISVKVAAKTNTHLTTNQEERASRRRGAQKKDEKKLQQPAASSDKRFSQSFRSHVPRSDL